MRKWIYMLIIALTVYLNIMYEWDLGVRILAAEVCLLPFCILQVLYVRKKLDVQIYFPKDMLEQKEKSAGKILLDNSSVFSACVKVVYSYRYATGERGKKEVRKVYIKKGQTAKLDFQIVPEHCGQIQIGAEKVYCYDFAGIVSWGRRCRERVTAVVMPKPYPVNLCITNRTRWFPIDGESYEKERSGDDASEIYDVREYQAGDRMQKVHWKLSAREDNLYIKEFSYPLGAAVILILEESPGRQGITQTFLQIVISLSVALQERECPHYIVWKKKEEDSITRILIRREEDLYTFIPEFLRFSKDCLETDMVEQYRYKYKNDTYSTMLKLDTALCLEVNEDEPMRIDKKTAENFFQTVEIVV